MPKTCQKIFTSLSKLVMWDKFNQPQTTLYVFWLFIFNLCSHLQRKTPSQVDMPLSFSPLHLQSKHSIMCTKTWDSWVNSILTQKVSNSSQKMQVWELEKSGNSINHSKNLETSAQLPSDSLKFLLKTKDLCSLRMLPTNTWNFINNSTKKKKSQSSQQPSFQVTNKLKFYQPWRRTPRIKAKSSCLNSRKTNPSWVVSKCTLNPNSWSWVFNQDLTS